MQVTWAAGDWVASVEGRARGRMVVVREGRSVHTWLPVALTRRALPSSGHPARAGPVVHCQEGSMALSACRRELRNTSRVRVK